MKIVNVDDDYNVLIIGCGRLGASIANTLSNKNKDVTIIDINKDSFRKLSPSFGGLTIEGDATNLDMLKEALIEKADFVMVVTNSDNINIMVAQIAKVLFGINNVISRLYDPEKECVYKEYGIKTIFPALLSANEVDKILKG